MRVFTALMMAAAKLTKVFTGYPVTVLHALEDALKDYDIYGDTSQSFVTIDDTQYKIPSDITLLDNSGSTASAFASLKSSATGYYDFTTHTWTASTFTAGNNAPSPSQPLDVVSVGDKTENLIPEDAIAASTTMGGVTLTNEGNGWYKLNGITTEASYSVFDFAIPTVGSGNYRLSVFNPSFIPATATWSGVGLSTGSGGVLSGRNCDFRRTINNTKTFTIDSGVECPTLELRAGTGAEFVDFRFRICLVKGTGALPEYIPYGYKIPVAVGNNCGIVDLGTLTWLKCDSVATGHGNQFRTVFDENIIATGFTESRLYVNGNGYKSATTYGRINLNDKEISQDSTNSLTDRVVVVEDASCDTADAIKKQLSGVYMYYQRSTDTSWTTPTITNIYLKEPLRKLGNYADYIDYENQRVVRNIGSIAFDGTEGWEAQTYVGACYSILKTEIGASTAVLPTSSTNIKSNCFSVLPTTQGASADKPWIGVGNSYINFNYDNGTVGISGWKTYLAAQYAAGTPVTACFPLASPTTESVTLPEINMAEGTDIITTNTTVAPSNMSVEAYVSEV